MDITYNKPYSISSPSSYKLSRTENTGARPKIYGVRYSWSNDKTNIPFFVVKKISFTITNIDATPNTAKSFSIKLRGNTSSSFSNTRIWNNSGLFDIDTSFTVPNTHESLDITINTNIIEKVNQQYLGITFISDDFYNGDFEVYNVTLEGYQETTVSLTEENITTSYSTPPYFYNISLYNAALTKRLQFKIKTDDNNITGITDIKIKTGSNTFYEVPKLPHFIYNTSNNNTDQSKLYAFRPPAAFTGKLSFTISNGEENKIKYLIFKEGNMTLNNTYFGTIDKQPEYRPTFEKDRVYYILILNLNNDYEYTSINDDVEIDLIPV